MPYCAILECKNDSRRANLGHGGISYHRFPKDPWQKSKWIDATGRQDWMPTKQATICSAHFCQNDILITEKGLRYIKNMAVPTRNIVTFVNQLNSARSPSSSMKRAVHDQENLSEPSPKKACRTIIVPTSTSDERNIPGPSTRKVSPSSPKKRALDLHDQENLSEPSPKKACKTSIAPTSRRDERTIPGPSGGKVSPGSPKKRAVDLHDQDNLSEPSPKKVYKTSIAPTSSSDESNIPGPSARKVNPSSPGKRAVDLHNKDNIFEPSPKKACKTSIAHRRLRLSRSDEGNIPEPSAIKVSPSSPKKRALHLYDQDDISERPPKKAFKTSVAPRSTSYERNILSPKILQKEGNTPPGSTYSTPRKQKLSGMLRWSKEKIKKQKLTIKRLQTQGRRLKRRLVNVEEILKDLKEKFAMTSEHLESLKNLNVQVQDLIARQMYNVKANVVSKKKYSPALRSFALTLNYYSPKAYEYVRRVFNTSLPHPRTLQKWYSKIGGDPGFTKEAFIAIKRKADSAPSPLVGTLVIDEMSIRRRIEWDGRRLHGYVDMGTGLEGDHLSEAKEALVFLITAINSNFKVPVGFFLVDGVTGLQRAELVKQCLKLSHNAGIKIVAVTFDGCAANVSMTGHLGCCLQDNNIKFEHPATHEPVVTVLDPCHMIKLIRNSFENYQIFIDSEGKKIEWKYLVLLNNLQYSETFHLSNKLKDRHINFKNERMKVKLATQLFSLSVAEAIQFCRQNLQLESFALSEATEKFLIIFNNIFDVFNSKNLHQHGYKKALNTNNAHNIFHFLDNATRYISTLRLTDGTLIIKSLRKTGFLGFVNCVEALKHLYASLIESKILIYLPFYKLSQDHLELFFCNIRCHGGSNNNPTARQFIAAYKKMLVHVELKDTNSGNCTALEQLSILNCSSAEERINRTSGLNQGL